MRYIALLCVIFVYTIFGNAVSAAQQTKKSTAKRAVPQCAPGCQQQIDQLNADVVSLKQAIAALLPVSQDWNTPAVNDANKSTRLTYNISDPHGTIYAITLKQLTNVGGTGVTLPVNPPVQVILADGGTATLKIPGVKDAGTSLSAGDCDWIVSLKGTTLTIDPSHCAYPKGYGATITIQSAR